MAEQKTPLYDEHVACEGRIVPFAGYLLPVQYPTGVIAEHKAVREKAGIFDVSHMGEATLEGPDALRNLNYILTNSFETLLIGSARYTLMLYDNGGEV
ncbi:MAG: glycine cleavage system aminomethyltransferase GcvT, partial [Ruthenibacterium sp.]